MKAKKIAQQGGNVAKVALKELESRTGKKVVSGLSVKKRSENTGLKEENE